MVADKETSRQKGGWYSGISTLLQMIEISIDRLPHFKFSLDKCNLLLTKKDINEHIQENIHRA